MESSSKILMVLTVVLLAGAVIIGGIILFGSSGNGNDSDAADYSGWEKVVSDLDTYGGSIVYDGRSPGAGTDPNHSTYSVSKATEVSLKGDVIFFVSGTSTYCIPVSHICAVSYYTGTS